MLGFDCRPINTREVSQSKEKWIPASWNTEPLPATNSKNPGGETTGQSSELLTALFRVIGIQLDNNKGCQGHILCSEGQYSEGSNQGKFLSLESNILKLNEPPLHHLVGQEKHTRLLREPDRNARGNHTNNDDNNNRAESM